MGWGLGQTVSWQHAPLKKNDFSFATGQQNGLSKSGGLLGASRVALNLKMTEVAKHNSVALTHHGKHSSMLNGYAIASQVAIRAEMELPDCCVWDPYSRHTAHS